MRFAIRGVPRLRRANAENARGAQDDAPELLRRIELQTQRHAKAVAQRRSELTGAGRRADEREFREVEPDGVRARSLADDDVDGVILHRGIEDLLHLPIQAVDLVDKENVVFLQIREQRGKVACLFDGWTGGDAHINAHLVRDDGRERRLAEPRRSGEQDVVQRLAAELCRLDKDLQVLLCFLLPCVFAQKARAERALDPVLRKARRRRDGRLLPVKAAV